MKTIDLGAVQDALAFGDIARAKREFVSACQAQTGTTQQLIEELKAWCVDEGFPYIAADELLAECADLNETQRQWLIAFCKRWENAEAVEAIARS